MTIDINSINNKDNKDNQMYICTEIAAAESIRELNYETPKAKQK